ncbi:MAG: glycosyltransferase family 2 protein [Solirubrobacterales bacterium]
MSEASPDRPMIVGILMTRNEVDVLRLNIVHHLYTSCDRVIVIDNGSTDRSRTVLKRLAKKLPLDWTLKKGALDQGEAFTAMAQEARAMGAEWVIPLDTDEFWRSVRPIAEILAEDTESGALEVSRIEFIQARDQKRSNAQAVLRATMRVPETLRGVEPINEFMAAERSMFETEPQPKVLLRATPELVIPLGAHTATGLAGPVTVATEIAIFHVPLRSSGSIAARAANGRRLVEHGGDQNEGFQARYWGQMGVEGRLAEAWRAHSYADGALDVNGRRVELIEDDRFVELIGPWVRTGRDQLIARMAGKSW